MSILDDVDFELELIHRDEINVTYILKLLAALKDTNDVDKEAKKKEIVDLLTGEANLRSKRELIEKFINDNLPEIDDADDVPEAFEKYWSEEQQKAFDSLVKEENLSSEKTQKLIEHYLFAEREPLSDDLIALRNDEKPKIRERKSVANRLLSKVVNFVETFISGMD